MKIQTLNGKVVLANKKALKAVDGGGEEFVRSYTGDGGKILDTSDLPSGLYRGHRREASTTNTDAIGFYLVKQDAMTAFLLKNRQGNYKNYVQTNGQINSNNASFLFNGDYDVFKIADLSY